MLWEDEPAGSPAEIRASDDGSVKLPDPHVGLLRVRDAQIQPREVAVMVGSPALYLVGVMLFKRASSRFFPLSHPTGLAMLAALAMLVALRGQLPPLLLAAIATLVLIVVAGWETISLRPTVGQPA